MIIRTVRREDLPFLWSMLYEAVFTPPAAPRPRREVIDRPEVARYLADWPRAGDEGLMALDEGSGEAMGTAWRIGSTLLGRLVEMERAKYDAMSLSVGPENPAVRLYRRAGFQSVDGLDRTMVVNLTR